MSRDYVLKPFRGPLDLRIDYAAELNPQQHAAVTAPPGPALVIAGAGAGKTRTLTYRVAYLLEQGIPPDRILLLTFTNKAAREMMHRVGELIGGELPTLWGGTFHSIGNRVLRHHADRLGYRRDFTILDRGDAEDLIQASLDDSGVDVKATRFPKPGVLADVFSFSANTGRTVPEVLAEQFTHFEELTAPIEDIGRRYAARKLANGVMDFDDLLVLWLRLLREHTDVCESYQRRFQFVLVDEYQDTNRLQGDLVDLLAARHHNIMVVGDDSQSIYSWRGADFRNILGFPERHAGAKVYKIETNYRSTPEILALANAAITANTRQFAKELAAVRPAGSRPALITCQDAGEQALFVAQRALELRDEGVPLSEMAVLYRAHFHAMELQLELTRRNIPFQITSGIRFFEQAHIKDVAAYLRLLRNPADETAFKRLARLRPGVGGRTADKLWRTFDTAVRAEAPAAAKGTPVAAALQACAAHIPRKGATAWAQFTATIAQMEHPGLRDRASELIRHVLEAEYREMLQAEHSNAPARLEDLEQLAVYARQFESVEDFLTQLALLSNVEAEGRAGADGDDEQLRLSTIHQAKGLEFRVVFVIMLCDGLFPSGRSSDSLDGLEEERRLFYVAVTRAKNELYLLHPLIRHLQGGGDSLQIPSRFLEEIPPELREEWNLGGYG